MNRNEDLIETLAPAAPRAALEDRRRPGRPDSVLPNLLPLLRDPAGAIASDGGTAIKARLMALTAVCLCLALGFALRGIP